MIRTETRIERYNNKINSAIKLPASFVTINFMHDDNLAFIIRTAACFGVRTVHVIGSIPERKFLYPASGSLVDFVELRRYNNPIEFLKFAGENNFNLISAELTNDSKSLYDFKFDFSNHTSIILGNEMSGVPTELLLNSEIINIPMSGIGYCLNTSQVGTAFISEYVRQFQICVT